MDFRTITAAELKPGMYFKTKRQRNYRECINAQIISKENKFSESIVSNIPNCILIIYDNCNEIVMHQEKELQILNVKQLIFPEDIINNELPFKI